MKKQVMMSMLDIERRGIFSLSLTIVLFSSFHSKLCWADSFTETLG